MIFRSIEKKFLTERLSMKKNDFPTEGKIIKLSEKRQDEFEKTNTNNVGPKRFLVNYKIESCLKITNKGKANERETEEEKRFPLDDREMALQWSLVGKLTLPDREMGPDLTYVEDAFISLDRELWEISPNGDGKNIFFVKDETDLCALFEKKDITVDFFSYGHGFKKLKQFFRDLPILHLKEYKSIGCFPSYPPYNDEYLLKKHKHLIPEKTDLIEQFLNFFEFETFQDRLLAKAFILSPLSSNLKKPFFIIAGKNGASEQEQKNIGKSTFVDAVQRIVQGSVMRLNKIDVVKTIKDQIYSHRYQRLFSFDNVTKKISSDIWGDLICSETISFRPLYQQSVNIDNRFTFCATYNVPDLDVDMADKAIIIRMKRKTENRIEQFDTEIKKWIDENHSGILNDIYYHLEYAQSEVCKSSNYKAFTRFPEWEHTTIKPNIVLNKIQFEELEKLEKLVEREKNSVNESVHDDFIHYVADSLKQYKMVGTGKQYDVETDDINIFIGIPTIIDFYNEYFNGNLTYQSYTKKIQPFLRDCYFSDTERKRFGGAQIRGVYFRYNEKNKVNLVFINPRQNRQTHEGFVFETKYTPAQR